MCVCVCVSKEGWGMREGLINYIFVSVSESVHALCACVCVRVGRDGG